MKATFKSQKRMEDTKTQGGKEPRADEIVDIQRLPPKEWLHLRPVGPVCAYGKHWVPVSIADTIAASEDSSKKKKSRPKSFPQVCLAFDSETEEVDSTKHCPWCEAESEYIRLGVDYFQNFIVRAIQEDEPKKKGKPTKKEAKTGFKEKGSPAWTPVKVIQLSGSTLRDLKKLGALNRHKDKKTGEKKVFSLSHEKYGRDISIQYDPDEPVASKRVSVQLGDVSPLTEEEQDLLLWNIENLETPKSPKDAKTEYERWAKRNADGLPKKGKKSKDDDDDEDLDDEDDLNDDDDDEDDKPKKSKKSKGKDKKSKGKKSKDEDDDDDDDEDEDEDDLDDDDDDDDEPKKKSKGKKAKPSKKSKDEDDDDEDEDDDDLDDDEDDEDDEPKKKAKPKGKGKKKKSKDDDDDDDEEEDDLDDDDDLDDEDDEDVKPSKKSKGKKSKDEDDDDDEDEDDLDDDDLDDEDDEPKKKSKGKKAKPSKKSKGKKKKKSKDEDEDDDD